MKKLENAKKIYQSIQAPPQLQEIVSSSFDRVNKKRGHWYKPALCTAASVCILFVALLNCSSVFAQGLSTVPVLGNLARVFTFRQYSVEDTTRQIRVKQPKVAIAGNPALEERINKEIGAKINAAVAEAEKSANEDKQAFLNNGGNPDDMYPVMVDIDYAIKCSNEKTLSFVINKTETQANEFTEQTFYNIDLNSGKELMLTDMLGENYKQIVDDSVRKQIKERTAKDDSLMFFDGDEAFSGIDSKQKFYMNEAGNVVIVFAKYEIAPGCMGIQEFEIVK